MAVWKTAAQAVTYDGTAVKNPAPRENRENGQRCRKRTIRARLFGHKIRCQSGHNHNRPTTPNPPKVRSENNSQQLIEAVRDQTRIVDLKQVNRVLIQPHWRKDCDDPL